MLKKITPELPFDDVTAGVAHYRDVLGFPVDPPQHDIGVRDPEGDELTFGQPRW